MEIAVYSTASTAAAQRAAEWSRVIADTYFPLQLTYRDPGGFSGELERRQMGQVSLSRLATGPMQYERHARDIAHNNPEEYLVTVPRRGPVDFSQMGREVRCAPGGLILERGDEPYRFSYTQPNELCVLKVSRPMLLERLRDPDRFCAQTIDARSGLSALLVSMMGHLQALSAAESHAANVLGRQIVEVLALALDERSGPEDAGAVSAVRAGHLRRAERVIRQNLSNPALSPEFVAGQCGISKRYLHELFGDTDKTVAQFIREERLIVARNEIAASQGLALAEIAYRYGFSDQAQLSRLFKSQFGMTPSDWRRRARSAG